MKRTPLLRRTPLARKSKLRSRPRPINRRDPALLEWKTVKAGPCQCGCGRFSMHLEHHHVVAAEKIRQEGREDLLWDPRNGMYLHPTCHERHTSASRRVPLASVPAAAREFAVELLGFDPATLYMVRRYAVRRSETA